MTNKHSAALTAGLLLIVLALAVMLAAQPLELEKAQAGVPLAVAERYETAMNNCLAEALYGEEAAPKQYWISDTAQAAPAPDQTCYGEAESPAELQWLLDEAETLLDGQELYFSTDTEIIAGSTIHYYLDDTILAITWKEGKQRVAFTYSEVKLLHPSQFRRYLSGGSFGSGTLSQTTEMSESVNAVVACSGDYYAYRRKGITVLGGVVEKAVPGVADTCFVDRNGDLLLERNLPFETAQDVQDYVDEHDVNFSLSFGPILIKDGENVCPNSYALGEVTRGFPRAAICQMGPLHYLFVVTNMEPRHYNKLTMKEFAAFIEQTGCRQAYALDGGQTATAVMNNQLMNNVNYGSQRLISDILYFATAKPVGGGTE